MNEILSLLPESLTSPLGKVFAAIPPEAGLALLAFGLLMLGLSSLRRRGSTSKVTEITPGRFEARAVLNAPERRLHQEIERLMPQMFHSGARLLSQVAIAEFLYAPDKQDFWTIGSSRVDLLITDHRFQPLCAIEYQGAGHYGNNAHSRAKARSRDWAKRRALRIAGVPLVEIPAQYDTRLLIDRLGDVTGRRPEPAAPAAPRRKPDLPAQP